MAAQASWAPYPQSLIEQSIRVIDPGGHASPHIKHISSSRGGFGATIGLPPCFTPISAKGSFIALQQNLSIRFSRLIQAVWAGFYGQFLSFFGILGMYLP